MKGIKISKQETAERSVHLDLSIAEMIALVDYHMRDAKASTRRFGAAAMQLNTSPLPQSRKLKMLHDACTENVHAHQRRAKGIIALAQEFAANNPPTK
jgi:hypothetical protein